MSQRLVGRVALITGATAGIGRAAAELFAQEGASVALIGRNAAAGAALESCIVEAGGSAIFLAADVTEEDQVVRAIERALEAFGKLDLLYNNAGGVTADDGPLTEVSNATFWHAIKLNLFGTWLCSKLAIPHIQQAGGGSIIHTVSGVALKGRGGGDAYAAAKGAVVSLTRSMAVEYAPTIRVNAISPTKVLTDRVAALRSTPNLSDTLSRSRELLGWGQPIDVANAAVFLASNESRMITGHILTVDSGTSMS